MKDKLVPSAKFTPHLYTPEVNLLMHTLFLCCIISVVYGAITREHSFHTTGNVAMGVEWMCLSFITRSASGFVCSKLPAIFICLVSFCVKCVWDDGAIRHRTPTKSVLVALTNSIISIFFASWTEGLSGCFPLFCLARRLRQRTLFIITSFLIAVSENIV